MADFPPRKLDIGAASPKRSYVGAGTPKQGEVKLEVPPSPVNPRKLSKPDIHSRTPHGQFSFWDSEPVWIALYFFFNLALTLYNKIALNTFPYPWSLTCIHSLCATLGTMVCEKRGYFVSTGSLGRKETITLVAFSTLYTVNIAISNLSLNLVSVPLHQVVRSTTPLFTIVLSIALFGKSFQTMTYLSLVPVIIGVALATHGDYSCTALGFFLTLFSSFLASVKGITTNRILIGSLKFHPLELLMRMSPLAFAQCLIMSLLSGEAGKVYNRTLVEGTLSSRQWTSLWVNGAVAFGLNVVSFTANKKAGALTMDVAANVKQVLTIVLAVMIFDLHINFVNFLGIALTIAGGAFYSYVEYSAKQQNAQSGTVSPTAGLANGGTAAAAVAAAANGDGNGLLPALSPASRKKDDDLVPLFHRRAPSGAFAGRT